MNCNRSRCDRRPSAFIVWSVGWSVLACCGQQDNDGAVADEGASPPVARDQPPGDAARHGAFGFPQAEAQVVQDDESLRVSVWNDASSLYVQAIVWDDGDDALGETRDGRPIGDHAYLRLDVDADGSDTANVDRIYSLNPWPTRPGLRYQVVRGSGRSTKFQHDSAGRGSIQYIALPDGRLVRVDSFVIPLSEIGRRPGDQVRLAYWAMSPHPDLILNSVGYRQPGSYYSGSLPLRLFDPVVLADRPAVLDPATVPEGREEPPRITRAPMKPPPPVGTVPPELSAADWINVDSPPTLATLRGQVALVEFFSPSCAKCVRAVSDLNELHDRYAGDGLRIVAFTRNSRRGIEWFMERNPIRYVVGTGTELRQEYGAPTVPYAYLIGRDGRLLWHGDSMDSKLHEHIVAALR